MFLNKNKLWDNTIIIFTSDHGWNFGNHNFFCKNSLIEQSTHVPLIIKPSISLKNIKSI